MLNTGNARRSLGQVGGLAQLARAPALQAGGHRFDSDILHREWKLSHCKLRRACLGSILPAGRVGIIKLRHTVLACKIENIEDKLSWLR